MVELKPTRTVAQKMGIRPGMRASLCNAPETALAAMRLPELDLAEEPTGEFDYLHLFVVTQDAMREQFRGLRDRLRPRGMLWVSWPKGGGLGTDLSLSKVVEIAYAGNMVESTCLRIDDTWSALKFTHPKPGKTYSNRHGTLPGQRT